MAMRRVLPLHEELPLLDAPQTRRLEQQAAAALPAHALMRRAGSAVARLALALAPHAHRVWIAAGPGNNGGDGLDAAIHLAQAGKRVEVALIGDANALPADAADALARAQAAGVAIGAASAPTESPDFAIDALLGVGASRAPAGAIAQAIQHLNALACPVLAVDLPSGLDAVTGQPLGGDCVIARHTVAMLTLKPGLWTGAGRDHAGEVWLETLDLDPYTGTPTAWLSGVRPTPARRHDQNKGSFGDVAVVGGAPGMNGAGLLAARAALSAGAGRVFLDLLDHAAATPRIDIVHPELMFREDWIRSTPEVLARTTVVCGCGGGDAVREPLPRLLGLARRLVLDADALNALATDPMLADLLRARGTRDRATVLTPHPLEAARLLGCQTAEVQADRLAAAGRLVERYGCVVVLKGSGTVIAAPGEVPRINSTGNAALATAGTGDVLAGWLGGSWTQRSGGGGGGGGGSSGSSGTNGTSSTGSSGGETALAFDAACRAVAEHGAAAEPQPAGSLRASDLIERLHRR